MVASCRTRGSVQLRTRFVPRSVHQLVGDGSAYNTPSELMSEEEHEDDEGEAEPSGKTALIFLPSLTRS